MNRVSVEECFAEFDKHKDALLQEYFAFLRFKSISTDPAFSQDVRNCAEWLARTIKEIGFDTEIWETAGHPTIFASWMNAGADKPTVLIYNHYDVQPVDPVELWDTPPFEPTEKNGQVYARGAQDNKGQCFYVLAALRHLMQKHVGLPVNLKWCIEGEEETGSANFPVLLQEKKGELKADHLIIADMGLHSLDKPAATLGVRGIVAIGVELVGSSTDMHSGTVGGIAYNPNRALAELIAKLYGPNGEVAIPGFYDGIAMPSEKECEQFDFSFDLNQFHEIYGAEPTGGEVNAYSPLERASIRPTLEINGISGGYTGDGLKTVIPAKASAKISCRLVPNQKPEYIKNLVIDFLKNNVAPGIKIKIDAEPHGGRAIRAGVSAPVVQAVAKAYKEVTGTECSYILAGGSIPIAYDLAEAAGAEIVLMGYGLPDDKIHAPNEHFGIDRLRLGFATIVRTLSILGNTKS